MLVTIGGQEVAVLDGSLNLSDAIEERSTCSFVVRDDAGHYQKGQPVMVWDNEDQLVFAGVIDRPSEQAMGSVRLHNISCIDWHYLADKRIAAKAYENQTAGDIVSDLVTSYLSAEGVTVKTDQWVFLSSDFAIDVGDVATVQTGPTIKEAVFSYVPVSACLDALAEKANFIWYIDPEKVLHFVSRATYTAPWQLTEDDLKADSLQVERSNPKYRNRQYVKGGRDVTDPQTETRAGDGKTTAFAMGFPMAKVPTITVNGVAQTVGIKGIDSGKQWYWSKGDPIITQDQAGTPLISTDTLSVTYQGEYDIVVLSEDTSEVNGRQVVEGGGTGYVEDVEDAPETSNRDSAFQLANAKLERYARIGRRIRFRTRRAGLRPGQLLTVSLSADDLVGVEALIESVEVSDEGPVLWYDVTAVEGPEQGSWAKMFSALAFRGQSFVDKVNIGEDRILVVLQTVNETWSWGESITETVYACPIPSTSLYPSTTLYPC